MTSSARGSWQLLFCGLGVLAGVLAAPRPTGAQETPPASVLPAASSTASSEGPTTATPVDKQWRIAANFAPRRKTDLFSDGHFDDGPTHDFGLQSEYLASPKQWMRLGVGLRASFGLAEREYTRARQEQFVFVPVLFGASWRATSSGGELEGLVGLGVLGAHEAYGDVWLTGLGAEASVSWIQPLTANVALLVGAACRFYVLQSHSGENSYLRSASGFHDEIPLTLGVRFRL